MTENEEVEHETESKVFENNVSCSGEDHDNGSEDEPIWPARSKRMRRSYISTASILKVFQCNASDTLWAIRIEDVYSYKDPIISPFSYGVENNQDLPGGRGVASPREI